MHNGKFCEKKWDVLCDTLKLYDIPKITEIRLESTNRCGYNCFMCPRKKMTRPIGTMSIGNLNYVLDCFNEIKYELSLHMHGFGETLLLDDLPQRIELIKTNKPNFAPLIFTTLGYERDEKWIESLFASGLETIVVSCYGYDRETYKNVHGVDRYDLVKNNIEYVASLKNKYGFNVIIAIDNFGEHYPSMSDSQNLLMLRSEFWKLMNDLGMHNKFDQSLHTFGGEQIGSNTSSRTLPCSVCWGKRRGHISISWDLRISPCAYDYDCSVIWGNLKVDSLDKIFASSTRMNFIKSHFEGIEVEKHPICSKNSCFPEEKGYESEFKIVKDFMEDYHG